MSRRSLRLSVIGTGYLGAVHATAMAELGHEVIGADTDAWKVERLAASLPPFFEPGLAELLRRHVHSGRLRFTTSLEEAAHGADIHFVCVGTPQLPDSGAADLSYLDSVFAGLAPLLGPADLVVGKSTVPVGTSGRLARVLADLGRDGGARLAWNPEFLREGFAVRDSLEPDRIVFGVSDDTSRAQLEQVYAPIVRRGIPRIVTDPVSAELVKVAANSFLATKISFINAISQVCTTVGADVTTVADAIGFDSRIGRRFLDAGAGFGGGCLGKDIRAFAARSEELGVSGLPRLLRTVDEINSSQRDGVVDLVCAAAGDDLSGLRIGVLGVTFKPDSDDVRDSAALDIARSMHRRGAEVRVYDPQGAANAMAAAPELDFVGTAPEVFDGAHAVVHLTEWSEFGDLDPVALYSRPRQRVLVDARNRLDAQAWSDAGWDCFSVGRPPRFSSIAATGAVSTKGR
ncbi:MAG: UDP-glucose dehydrogenase family protein [Beutenbergiaceae bacterium]